MKTYTIISEHNYIISSFNVSPIIAVFKQLLITFYVSIYPALHFLKHMVLFR